MNVASVKVKMLIGLGLMVATAACLYWCMDGRGAVSLVMTADQQGMMLYKQERFSEAAEVFVNPQWKATALYRAGRFKDAGGLFSGDASAEGAFNQANALCMQGRYAEAIPRYERALVLKPGWPDAEANLAIARSRAEKLQVDGGDMTGGQLAADDYVFTEQKPAGGNDGETETVEAGQQTLSDAEMRAVWLRGVETQPADFLRSKFAYQAAMEVEE